MATATITVERVEKKPTQKGDVFRIFDEQNREFATFKADLGQHAYSLIGQTAHITYTEKQNGQFVNRYLEEISPAFSNAGPAASPVSDTQDRIERQSAIKAAIDTLQYVSPTTEAWGGPSADDVFKIADAYARYYKTGEKPAAVTRQTVGQSSLDADIPF